MTDSPSHYTLPHPGNRAQSVAPRRAGDGQLPPAGPAKGAWVEVAHGPAQGARGRVIERVGDNVTIVALLLGQRPFLLTVASAVCTPLDAPPERW